MNKPYLVFVSAMMLASVPSWAAPQGITAPQVPLQQTKVDALFSPWNQPDTPGAAVAVLRGGEVVYRRAFGMADIEQGQAITRSTSFHVASLSKQFTAFAILLLAQEGKLSLDDDIHQYLPDLPNFGPVIRIRHLLAHTSGLRDQWNLLALAGWRMDDVITDDDVMRLVRRQRALNFVPGSEHNYSNTGYTLLAAIVHKVSGKSLAAFSKERIFDPLGMRHTAFQESYSKLVAGRAHSYQPATGGGYEAVALSYSTVGATSLLTTLDDLILWARNFDDARVGGKQLLAQMQTSGTLNDGSAIGYGAGLGISAYRGLLKVDHSGSDAGFRSYLGRFPDQQLTIIIAANGADVQAPRLGFRIADIYLDGQLEPFKKPVTNFSGSAEIKFDPAKLDALAGTYKLEDGSAITFAKEQGRLVGWTAGDDKMPFYPMGEREFFAKLVNASFRFDPPNANGVIEGGTWSRNTRSTPGKRIAPPPGTKLEQLEGEYYSDELHVLYTISSKNGKVILSHPRGDVELAPFETDSFVGPWPFGLVKFTCAAPSGCTRFTVSESRASDVEFSKVAR